MELEEVAEELYGLLPDRFIAARDWRSSQLRHDGELELAAAVKTLRRPTMAAWLVNALVRHRTEEVEGLLVLGEALRRAETGLDPVELRELNRRRQELLAALGREARVLARSLGRPVSEPVVDDVEDTLRAALADPAAAQAVRTGRLTTSLSYAGLGEVDLAEVVAPGPDRAGDVDLGPAAAQALGGHAMAEAEAEAARRAAQERAWAALRVAEEVWHRAEQTRRRSEQHRDLLLRRAETARERMDAARARVVDLEGVLATARQNLDAAVEAWQPLRHEADTALDAVEQARAASDAARAEVDAARAGVDAARAEIDAARAEADAARAVAGYGPVPGGDSRRPAPEP